MPRSRQRVSRRTPPRCQAQHGTPPGLHTSRSSKPNPPPPPPWRPPPHPLEPLNDDLNTTTTYCSSRTTHRHIDACNHRHINSCDQAQSQFLADNMADSARHSPVQLAVLPDPAKMIEGQVLCADMDVVASAMSSLVGRGDTFPSGVHRGTPTADASMDTLTQCVLRRWPSSTRDYRTVAAGRGKGPGYTMLYRGLSLLLTATCPYSHSSTLQRTSNLAISHRSLIGTQHWHCTLVQR